MYAQVSTVAFEGIEAKPVDVQVQITSGLPAFTVVGLPDKAVGESRERVRGAAGGDRSGAAAQAHHRQSGTGRSAQGRQSLRPPHRARPDGGLRRRRARRARRVLRARRIVAGRVRRIRRRGCCPPRSAPTGRARG